MLDEEKDGELECDEIIASFKNIFQLEFTARKWAIVIKNIDFAHDGSI